MSDLLNFATIALVGVVQASFQLSLGGLLLLTQSSLEKHSRLKTRTLARSYIVGNTIMPVLTLTVVAFLIERLFGGALPLEARVILLGMLFASTIVMWFFYYRRGSSTELWLPRSFARFMRRSAKSANNTVAAFALGLLSYFAEMPMSIALCVVTANAVLMTSAKLQILALCCYALACALPLLIATFRIRRGRSVLEIQHWRLRNKAFARLVSGSSFLVLTIFIWAFWVIK